MSEGYRIHQLLSYPIIIYSPSNQILILIYLGLVFIKHFAKSYNKMAGFFFLIFYQKISNSIKKIIFLFERRDDKFFEHWSSSESIVSHLEV